jgi:GcrA cell cycle regulator
MDWNADAIERLKSLWTEGLSTAEIGRRLNISKNAVVGKAHRLALVARPSPIRRDPDAAPRSRQPAQHRLHGSTLPPLSCVPETPPGPACAAPEPRPFSLSTKQAGSTQQAGSTKQTGVPQADFEKMGEPAGAQPAAALDQPSLAQPNSAAPVPRQPEAPRRLSAPAEDAEAAPAKPELADQELREADAADGGPAFSVVAPVAKPVSWSSSIRARPSQRNTACCWPIGEPGTASFHFCGKNAATGRPYCEAHAEIAYVRVRDRRDNAA